MDLIEHSSEEPMTREEAADRLRALADELAKRNSLTFERDGVRHTVEVPKQLTMKLEIEVGSDGSEIEIELMW